MSLDRDHNGRWLVADLPLSFTPVMDGEFDGGIKRVCSAFGCARRLSLPESLAGSLCTNHMNTKPINITSTIKKP